MTDSRQELEENLLEAMTRLKSPRFQKQPGEITAIPNSQDCVLGFHNQHNPHDTDPIRGKGAKHHQGVLFDSQQGGSISEGPLETDWYDVSDDTTVL